MIYRKPQGQRIGCPHSGGSELVFLPGNNAGGHGLFAIGRMEFILNNAERSEPP